MNHDGNYKQIFFHPQTVIEPLQEFVKEEWIKNNTGTLAEIIRLEISTDLKEVRQIIGRLIKQLKAPPTRHLKGCIKKFRVVSRNLVELPGG